MTSKLLDGKKVADLLFKKIKIEVDDIKNKDGITPAIAVINVGDNPASEVYISRKQQKCDEIGIKSLLYQFDSEISQDKLIAKIMELNADKNIHGILVQLPLPSRFNENEIITSIDPRKDVDGFTPLNMGLLAINSTFLAPCTPCGIMGLLEHAEIELEGKEVVIINHSNVVGKPLALMMINKNATVSVCHEFTHDLGKHTKKADVLVVGVGKSKFITKEMIKENAIIIDVGINRVDNKIVGDVDFENVIDKCQLITPVPGGVGPMTVAMLMKNTIKATKSIINMGD